MEFTYPFLVDRVVDGDTFAGVIDLGFRIRMEVRVRLLGVDAPEVRNAKSDDERQAGLQAAEFVAELVTGVECVLVSSRVDAFGRALGRVLADGVDVNRELKRFLRENQLEKWRFP
jgi:micrococcal nuclease